MTSKPFILRSQARDLTADEVARQDQYMRHLTTDEVGKVSGATDGPEYAPEYTNKIGGDVTED